MKLHILQFYTASSYLLLLKAKYSLRHPILEHSQAIQCQRKSCISVYSNIYASNNNRTCSNYINTQKVMVFKGRDPVRSKIVMDNKVTEQVNSCNYSYIRILIYYEI